MKVTMLGAGVPTPTPSRFGSAYLLDVAGGSLLVDCGPSTTSKLVAAGRRPADVSLLLFTHHHFDHNADYPCFVLTRWDQDVDQTPLRVYGPPPTTASRAGCSRRPTAHMSATGRRGWSIQEVSASSRIAAGDCHARRRR